MAMPVPSCRLRGAGAHRKCAPSGFAGQLTRLVGGFFGQSKRLQALGFFANNFAVGLIFHHRLGAVFGALHLLETCFGAGLGLIRPRLARFCRQCLLPLTKSPALNEAKCGIGWRTVPDFASLNPGDLLLAQEMEPGTNLSTGWGQ